VEAEMKQQEKMEVRMAEMVAEQQNMEEEQRRTM